MPYLSQKAHNSTEAREQAVAALKGLDPTGLIPVVLVPSAAQLLPMRQALAEGGLGFGVRVHTFTSWVHDCWDLLGGSRRIIESDERALFLLQAMNRVPQQTLSRKPSSGMLMLISRLSCEALPALVDPLYPSRLSQGEQALVSILRHLQQLLREKGCCELSEAAYELPELMRTASPLVVVGFDEISPALGFIMCELSTRTHVVVIEDEAQLPDDRPRASELRALTQRLFGAIQLEALAPTGAVRFLLPSGAYASAWLLGQELVRLSREENLRSVQYPDKHLPVVVACKHPSHLFKQLVPFLADKNIAAAVVDQKLFGETAVGKAFLSLAGFVCSEVAEISAASDFALSEFSGISVQKAYKLDAAWRGNRMISKQQIEDDLSLASLMAHDVISQVHKGHFELALRRLGAGLYGGDDEEAWRVEQRAAVNAACSLANSAQAQHTPFSVLTLLLAELPVAYRVCTQDFDDSRSNIIFESMESTAERPSASAAAVILCNLSAADYPVKRSQDGGLLLLEKQDLAPNLDSLTTLRRRFFRVLLAARSCVVCCRVLHTEEGDEAYPSVMYEELLDCYRKSEKDPQCDVSTGLPVPLMSYSQLRGEDCLHTNLALADLDEIARRLEVNLGEVSACKRELVVVPRGPNQLMAQLSPSALESYLECPCKWFSLRRLRLCEPDAGFGPLEMGSFSHSVLKSFYDQFASNYGQSKVRPDNLGAAQALLSEVFETHLAFQSQLKAHQNPLVARSELEKAEVAELKGKLMVYLQREATLLPGFTPTYLEHAFGFAEHFTYAGCGLSGTIDRIDVNERGQAVVIDYKGSLTTAYELSSASAPMQHEGSPLPHKVQALVYAQVAQRLLGLNVVGALYVSYGRDTRIMGAIDRTVLGPESVAGLNTEKCGLPGPAEQILQVSCFSQLVQRVEDNVAKAVNSLEKGFIEPQPRGDEACHFCPVLSCKKRRKA